jgi:hypothetical protein
VIRGVAGRAEQRGFHHGDTEGTENSRTVRLFLAILASSRCKPFQHALKNDGTTEHHLSTKVAKDHEGSRRITTATRGRSLISMEKESMAVFSWSAFAG